VSDRNYGAIRDVETLEKFVNRCIQSGDAIGFDIEAGYTGPDWEKASLRQYYPHYLFTGFSFTVSTDWARYVPVNHDSGGNVDDPLVTARLLWRLVMSGRIVAHNAPYEITGVSNWLRKMLWNDPLVGKEIRETEAIFPILDDTMVLVWLTAEYDPIRIGKDLKSVCEAAFGMKMAHFPDLFPPVDSDLGPALPKAKIRFARFNTRNSQAQPVIDYACEDAVATLLIHLKHYDEWKDSFVFKFEMGLQPVLHVMERGPLDPDTGAPMGNILLDWKQIHEKAKECAEFRDKMDEEIQGKLSERLGRVVSINLGSVQQLRKILYDPAPEGLGLPINDKFRSEKTNEPSTSDDALRVLAKEDEVIRAILDYRQVVKLYGSYLHKFETDIDYSGTGVVFPNHNQAGALTGRMSVDHVSYQQWPKPYHYELSDGTTFDFNFRNILIAPPGFRIVGFDFSQIELRVLAGQSQETAMLKAFADGVDIHRATASTMLRIALDEVTKKQRGVGKTCNFAVVYGSGPANIADMLSAEGTPTTVEQAVEMLELYYAGFPRLREWMDKKIAEGHEQHYVETLFGRKFTIWEYKDHREWIKKKGDRMCVNAPIQGGAADYLKIGMNRVYLAIRKAEREGIIPKDSVRLFMTVHDALEFYVRDDVDTQTVIDLVNPCVTFPVKGLPEIRADWHEGQRWGLVVELELDDAKQVSGFEWEDPDGAKHHFESLEEAYAFQDSWISAKAKKGVEQIEAHLTEHNTSEPVFMDDNPDLSKVPEGTTVYPPAKELASAISDAFSQIEEGLRNDPETRRYHLDIAIRRGDYVLVDGPRDRAKPKSGADHKAAMTEDTDAAQKVKAGAKRLTREQYEDIIQNGFPELRDAAPAEPDEYVVIRMDEMPDEDSWAGFEEWAETQRGERTVQVETPEGTITLDGLYGIDESDQGMISLLLGGASVKVLQDAVGIDITEGVTL
jgi:DNA polymerase I-like protein with 3'-5' exonuclease and polymerase domains